MASRSVLLLLLAALGMALHCAAASDHTCIHGSRQNELITGVRLPGGDHVKRQSHQPIRFSTFPDSTITVDLTESKRNRIMNEVIPAVLGFLSSSLSVSPLAGPILLDRQCSSGSYYEPGADGVKQCEEECAPTKCGTVSVPEQHLKRCRECNGGQPQPPCGGEPATDGVGVSNTDYVLYISADQSECPPGSDTTVLAFAGACQMESTLDQPIAGYINFCPSAIEGKDNAFVFAVASHEMFHALAFSSQLFPYWRYPDGRPRTQRDGDGRPVDPSTNTPQASTSTVNTLTYPSWRTASGPVQHTVTALVTEAVVREGKAHFNCTDLEGVELENQGGDGTQGDHWEKRALGNEAMTGVFSFGPVFSRLSLAVMEDSGWYTVDYSSTADTPLLWGKDRGCGFVNEGCGDLVNQKNDEYNPFCSERQSSGRLGCTLGRGAVAQCNRVSFSAQLDPDFQYFQGSPQDGGSLQEADFCPFYRAFTYNTGEGTNCSDPNNQLPNNVRGEKYGVGSRCVGQGREWRRIKGSSIYSSSQYGGGCYEYECLADGVTIYVLGTPFKCSCEGEEHIVDVSSGSECVTGSIICPSCASICYDKPGTCPSSEPACYGRVVKAAEENCGNKLASTREVGSATALVTTSCITLLLVAMVTFLMSS